MGKPVASNIKRAETIALSTKINKEVFTNFKDRCAYLGYPMNVVLETFMQQYTNKRYKLSSDEILKWKGDNTETDSVNTTFNREIYTNFKSICKANGYFVKHVLTAFMDKFASGVIILEYVDIAEIKNE